MTTTTTTMMMMMMMTMMMMMGRSWVMVMIMINFLPVMNIEYRKYAPNSVLSATAPLTIVAAVAANTKWKNQ